MAGKKLKCNRLQCNRLHFEPTSLFLNLATRKSTVTIHDVARKAGVSAATVSRVLNNSNLVVAETGKRIRKIARELNYIPSASARSLSIRKTEAIGLLLPDMYGDFFSEIIRGADLAARGQNYHLIVSSSHSNTVELDAAVKTLSGRVDGMIIMSPHLESSTHLTSLLQAMPVVIIGSTLILENADHITIDNEGGAKQVVEYLLRQGHRDIAIIRGEENNQDADERLSGFRKALAENEIVLPDRFVATGNFTEQSGFDAARSLLDGPVRPTAIFCSNDSMAIGAISAIRQRGLRIPEDVSVCGFDDIPVAQFLSPSLTSVHVPIHELGLTAVYRLFERLASAPTWKPAQISVPSTLSIRNSCLKLNRMSNQSKEGNVTFSRSTEAPAK